LIDRTSKSAHFSGRNRGGFHARAPVDHSRCIDRAGAVFGSERGAPLMRLAGAAAFALLAAPAGAAVKSAAPGGFEVENRVAVAAPPAAVYAEIGRIGDWWDSAHTYSGDAHNMTLDLRAGGCFCERLPAGGGVEHMRVVYAAPASALRLVGGLGPLQGEGVSGVLTFSLKPATGGTEVRLDYIVGGYLRGGGETMAPAVDQVLGAQLERLRLRFTH
jgi:hypothetical protein